VTSSIEPARPSVSEYRVETDEIEDSYRPGSSPQWEAAKRHRPRLADSAALTKQQAPRRLICGGPALLLRWDRLSEQQPDRHAYVGDNAEASAART
jgi:hypothetical protein